MTRSDNLISCVLCVVSIIKCILLPCREKSDSFLLLKTTFFYSQKIVASFVWRSQKSKRIIWLQSHVKVFAVIFAFLTTARKEKREIQSNLSRDDSRPRGISIFLSKKKTSNKIHIPLMMPHHYFTQFSDHHASMPAILKSTRNYFFSVFGFSSAIK